MLNFDFLDNHSTAAIFGSSARKDSDSLSDVDLLIVTDNKKREDISREVKAYGYSPSIYSWNTLEKLSKNGSLFLIHLQQEAIILKDTNSKLKKLLLNTKPVGNYKKSQIESIQLAQVTIGISDSDLLKLWAADVLAVAFRNYVISYAAQKNKFIFSYSALIDYAKKEFSLELEMVECLTKLRAWKAQYRNKSTDKQTKPTITEIHLAQSFFKTETTRDFTHVCENSNDFFNKTLGLHNNRNWYQNLRIYEGAFHSLNKDNIDKKLVNEIEDIFSNPSFYTNDGEISWKKLKKLVSDLHNYKVSNSYHN